MYRGLNTANKLQRVSLRHVVVSVVKIFLQFHNRKENVQSVKEFIHWLIP